MYVHIRVYISRIHEGFYINIMVLGVNTLKTSVSSRTCLITF